MYYRYELYVDDEYQGIGFMRGIASISEDIKNGISEIISSAFSSFDTELELPEYDEFETHTDTCAFFTQYGNDYFKKHIENVIHLYEENTIYEVHCIQVENFKESDILYQDDYQVIVHFNSFNRH